MLTPEQYVLVTCQAIACLGEENRGNEISYRHNRSNRDQEQSRCRRGMHLEWLSRFMPAVQCAMPGETIGGGQMTVFELVEEDGDRTGVLVDTDKAAQSWDEATYWNGNNHISKATGDQFLHETLYKSSKGRYYIVHSSQWQGSVDSASEIDEEDAAKWLLLNEHELPEDLAALAGDLIE